MAMKSFYNRKNFVEFVSYFFEYEHLKLDILFCRTPSRGDIMKQLAMISSGKNFIAYIFHKFFRLGWGK